MIVNKSLLIAALAVLAAGASAQAADSKPASKPAAAPAQAQPAAGKPTPEQIADIERAAHIWQAFNVVMESKDATVPVKNALLACLYNNKLSTISVAAGKVFAANPNIPPTGVYSNNPGVTVTQDQVSRGDEFEVHGTVVRGWDVFLTASHVNAYRDNLAPSFVQWATQRWELFQGPAGDMRVSENFPGEGNSTDYPGQNGDTIRNLYKNVMANILFQLRSAGRTVSELKPWRFGAVTNYEFHEGKLKGLNFGGAYRWAAGNVTGTPVKMEADGINAYFDVAHPYKGKSEQIIDLWMGYRWKFARHLRWRTQLNVRNAFATDKLIAVTVQPDGSPAGYKIAEPRTFTLTNTIEF